MPKPIFALCLTVLVSMASFGVYSTQTTLSNVEKNSTSESKDQSKISISTTSDDSKHRTNSNVMPPPVITPPVDITMGTDNNLCQANVTVPPLMVSGSCPPFNITNNYTQTANASGIYALGSIIVTWTVTDNCGNMATEEQIVTVVDNQGPNLMCKGGLTLALNDFINDIVPATYFVEATPFDNCGGNVTLKVRRIIAACGIMGSNTFSSSVPFCCDDVPLANIMVAVQATDARNKITTCMVNVDVQDNIAPIIHDPLPDISISCEFPLDLNDLSVFGTFVAEGQPRQQIIIENYIYEDGVYFDNCQDVTVSVDTSNLLVMCNTGNIVREFTFEDAMGNTVTSTQTISVIDVNPFSLDDIDWPDQQTFFDNCNVANPSSTITGKPELNNDKCSMAAATYKDLSFAHNQYCRGIKRTWTVVDWCQYVPNTSIGKWTFEQYIYVTNDVPPTIDSLVCQPINICTNDGSCDGHLNVSASGNDDCLPVQISWRYKIDEGNNNTIDFTGNGSTINRPISRGTHRVIWEANDKCGNVASCEKLIQIKECKAPTGIVHYGLAVSLPKPMGMASIEAKKFDNWSSDNCTPSDSLKFSFSSVVSDRKRTFDCSHEGRQYLQIWITDQEGNQTIVDTYLEVQDIDSICNNLQEIMIAGQVRTIDHTILEGTKIMIEGGETLLDQMTNIEGKFSFHNLGMYNDYRVMGERTSEPLEGISTLDLVLIQRHILGIDPLTSPQVLLAADVDGSGKINSIDLVTLRKLILGSLDSFPNNKPWIFMKEGQSFIDPKNPWIENFDFNFINIDTSIYNSDFLGIKIGDVNHSYSEDLRSGKMEARSHNDPEMIVEDIVMKSNEIIPVSFTAKNFEGIIAQQFTLELLGDVEYVGFESKELPITADQIALIRKGNKKYLTVAFHSVEPVNIQDGEILLDILLRSPEMERLSRTVLFSNDITQSKIYSEKNKRMPLRLQYISQKRPELAFIKQNQPNPFKEETTLEFYLTEKGLVNMTIFDSAGKLVYKNQQEGNVGLNTWALGPKELGEDRGILFVKIKSGGLNEVVRMMRIE